MRKIFVLAALASLSACGGETEKNSEDSGAAAVSANEAGGLGATMDANAMNMTGADTGTSTSSTGVTTGTTVTGGDDTTQNSH